MNFNDVKAPRDVSCAELLEPSVGASFDQLLFVPTNRLVWANFAVGLASFDFDEEQHFSVTCNDIDFSFAWAPEVGGEDSAAIGL